MLPTFVIGLREGLEAALIVGIVAAFLRQRGRMDLLRRALFGVLAAVILCAAVGVTLQIVSANLPQRQQEGLETVIGAVAVLMVTYMVVWMRRHSRNLRGQLEGAAADAVASGSGWALVFMAFLAVLREGLETAVFLLAAFNESKSGASAGVGAALGVGVAVVLGYGIYRGGVRINLSKFFRFTGLVLVVVAAGLVVSALHTAHEAGWLNTGQQRTFDLTNITRPGSVQSSLLTGMLGIQDRPVRIELIGWLLYLVPVTLYVAWPAGRTVSRTLLRRASASIAIAGAVAAASLALTVPAVATAPRLLQLGTVQANATLAGNGSSDLTVTGVGQPGGLQAGAVTGTLTGENRSTGLVTDEYQHKSVTTTVPAGKPVTATAAEVAALNGGRLPLGTGANTAGFTLSYATTIVTTWSVEVKTGALVDVSVSSRQAVSAAVGQSSTAYPLGTPASSTVATPEVALSARLAAVRSELASASSRQDRQHIAVLLAVVTALGAVTYLLMLRRPNAHVVRNHPEFPPVQHAEPVTASTESARLFHH